MLSQFEVQKQKAYTPCQAHAAGVLPMHLHAGGQGLRKQHDRIPTFLLVCVSAMESQLRHQCICMLCRGCDAPVKDQAPRALQLLQLHKVLQGLCHGDAAVTHRKAHNVFEMFWCHG